MSAKSIGLSRPLHEYLVEVSVRETVAQRQLREETAELPESNMQISPEQGQFMQLLAKMLGVRRYVEIGTFTGYSALSMALAMPDDGELVCIDKSEEWTTMARDYWTKAGVDDRISLRLGDGAAEMAALLDERGQGSFDFAFIDADKTGYDGYYETSLQLLRRGGVVAIDNTLWSGSVADEDDQEPDTVALRQLNEKLHTDERVDLSLVPIGDGLTLARKR
jgi:predicted O-methyltransferase YrrM